MNRTQFGALAAEPGQRTHGWVRVPGVEPPWEMPAFVIRGRQPGPTLAVTGGIHSAEYPGIANATRPAGEGDPATPRGMIFVGWPVDSPGFYHCSLYTDAVHRKKLNPHLPVHSPGFALH